MIDAKQAVTTAQEYFNTFFPHVRDVQLEEVEINPEGSHWLITLSFPDDDGTSIGLYPRNRKYKLFRIDAEKGIVTAMKMRER